MSCFAALSIRGDQPGGLAHLGFFAALTMTDRRSFLIARDDAILELLTRPLFLLVEIILQEAAGTGVAQLADGTFLDLADALACHPQLLAHLFQGVIVVVCQAEAQFDNLPLARSELGERLA